MNILILGASGLIGHRLYLELSSRFETVRGLMLGDQNRFTALDIFKPGTIYDGVDLACFSNIEPVLDEVQPDVILNCCGITRRRPEINDAIQSISVNSLLPHKLAKWSETRNCRVIHFSTDCVFDGSIGNYDDDAPLSGEDQYGWTKGLGEIRYDHALTIRSSFIGQELQVHSELLDWFLAQSGKTVKGFTNAMYSGVSTIELSRVVGDIIEDHPKLSGLYNLSIEKPVSKYELLSLAKKAFKLDVELVPYDDFVTDASLDGTKLRKAMDLKLPTWEEMMAGLAANQELYKALNAGRRGA